MSYLKTLLLVLALLASVGCIRSGTVEREKWAPEKRAETHVKLGMTYLRENQFDTAGYEFDAAIATNPKSDKAYHAKGLLLSRIGDALQATVFFKKAVTLNPKNYLAVNDYAIHLCQQGNSQRGIQQLIRIESVAANDQLLGTQLGLGVCYAENGKIIKANQYLRTVLEQAPYVPQALLPMAKVSFSQKEYLSSRAFLERYFGTGAISENSLFLAAKVEHKMGDLNKANQYRRELQRRYPRSLFNSKLKILLE